MLCAFLNPHKISLKKGSKKFDAYSYTTLSWTFDKSGNIFTSL